MKRSFYSIALALAFVLVASQANGQNQPAPSPLGKVYQRIGVTDFEVNYSRPSMKDRKIFGEAGIIPFGKLWRTGANAATTIKFSTDVMFDGKKVPAGEYAIFTIPDATEWTIILNKDAAQRGTGSYKEDKDVLRFKVSPQAFPVTVETLTILFGDIKDTSATLALFWENTAVVIPFTLEKTW